MGAEDKVGAVQLNARLCGVSPPVTRRLVITEQASLAQLHAALQVAFGWSDEHLYVFQIRGWQFGAPAGAIELALAGGGVDMPLAAFAFEVNEAFHYHYNLFVPWKIDCRIESRSLVPMDQPLGCLAARGDPPDEDLEGPAAYPDWLESSSLAWAVHQIEELLEDDLDGAQLRAEVLDIVGSIRPRPPRRRSIDQRLRKLPAINWDAGSLYEDADSTIIGNESGVTTTAQIAALERRESDDLIGISLEEAKTITGSVQRALVEGQAHEAIHRAATCADCQTPLRRNGSHRMSYRTPFGRLDLGSPRFYRCRCQTKARQSFSPLANWLGDHTSPELHYLEAQFAALLSYGVSARILGSVLPLQQATSITTWKRHVARVGGRLDEEAHHRLKSPPALNEFGLPKRNPLRAVGIDGGYVKASDAPSRQEGWFEVMVGKSLPREGSGQVFAFVHRLEPKANERMQRFLAEQGVFPAQPTTFLSDGGETVRQAQGEFREFGEPILDWFHVAMRTTQLTQSIKGLVADPPIEGNSPNRMEELLRELNRAKAYLWHGSPHRALRTLEDLTWDIGTESPRAEALQDKLEELMNYIDTNVAAIPNYADRHRHGEPIATGFVESAVNQVVSKRLVKKQQMRWTMAGAHRLLQVRTRVLNQQLRKDFERWHPQLRAAADPVFLAA